MFPYMREIMLICIGLNIPIFLMSVSFKLPMGIAVSLLSTLSCLFALWVNKDKKDNGDE